MRDLYLFKRLPLLLAFYCFVYPLTALAEDNGFHAAALRGVQQIQVEVEGVRDDFSRYGLTAAKLRTNIEQRLNAYGLKVLNAEAALKDKSASQIHLRLYANQDTYANYSCRVAMSLKRKLPLDNSGEAFVSKVVWSDGQNGLLNPSDLSRIYDYVDTMVDHFLSEHSQHNPGVRAATK